MTPNAWIAIVSVGVAAAFSLIGLVLQGLLAAFHFGRQSQRLASVEQRTRDVDANAAALAVLTSTVGGIDKKLAEVSTDVKNLLIGRIRPASRREPDA